VISLIKWEASNISTLVVELETNKVREKPVDIKN